MHRRSIIRVLPATAALLSGLRMAYAETYLTTEQAQRLLFPGESLQAVSVTLTNDQRKAIAMASRVRVREDTLSAWRTSSGGWFLADNVVGKHEFIDFALALTRDGTVKGVEIMTYRETYGGEVRHPKWRAQFAGKTASAPLELDHDIKNISGATLSSSHITEGVRRLLQTWDLVLKHL